MQKLFHAVVIAILAVAPIAARQKANTDVLIPIHQFVDAFNKGDTKAAIAACNYSTFIIDEFPPHEWHGTGACTKWMSDYEADATKNSITDGIVTLGTPTHVDVSGDRAYAACRATTPISRRARP